MLSKRESSRKASRTIRVESLVSALTFFALVSILAEKKNMLNNMRSAYGTDETTKRTAELANETTKRTEHVDLSWDRHVALLHPGIETRCAVPAHMLFDDCKTRCPEDPLTAAGSQAGGQEALYHEALVRSARSTSSDLDVVIMGDSITEHLNGTRLQGSVLLPESYGELFRTFFTKEGGGTLEGLALGAGGDTSQNLLWHLRNGMLPGSLRPKIWVILIGTNDLGKNRCSPEYVLAGILSVVKYVQTQRPGTPILLHGLLPRGERRRVMTLGIRWELVQIINRHLRAFCENHHNVYYMDSGDMFLSHNATMIDKKLMDDALHPTLKGGRQWVPLIIEHIHRIIGERKPAHFGSSGSTR